MWNVTTPTFDENCIAIYLLNVYHTTWPLYRLHCPMSRQVNKVVVVFVVRYKLLRRKKYLWILCDFYGFFVCFIYSLLLWLYVGIGGSKYKAYIVYYKLCIVFKDDSMDGRREKWIGGETSTDILEIKQ